MEVSIPLEAVSAVGESSEAPPLHCAAKHKDGLDNVIFTAEKGADKDSESEDATSWYSPLLVEDGLDILKYLPEMDENLPLDTQLCKAAMQGDLETVKNLLDHDVSVNTPDAPRTPVYEAARNGHNEVVMLLIEHGAKQDDALKGTFDRLQDAISQNSKESFDYCMSLINWFEQEKGWNPVYEAARNGHKEVVMLLIEHGAKQDNALKGTFDRLQDAISQNSKESFDYCVALINWFGQEGGLNPAKIWTLTARRTFALHRAAEAGSTKMVEAMIKLGVDVDIKSGDCESAPLWDRMPSSTFEVLEGARIKLSSDESSQCEPETLCKRLQTSLCGSVNDDIDNEREVTPLHFAAMKGNLEVVEILVKNGADIHHKGYKERTPLHLACYSGHAETASYLLNKGADPTVLDTFGNNCLHLAIRAQQSEIASLLLRDKRWKKMMKQKIECDNAHPELQTPLSNLIVKMPDVAELALSKCVETNKGKMEMYTNSIHPTSKEYQVTYHYDLLEECSSGSSRIDGDKDTFQRRNHPLFLIMKYNRPNLLKHPLVTSLLKSKWSKFGRKVFFMNLSFYILFLAFLTAFGLKVLSPLEPICERVLNGSFNGTQPDNCGGLSTTDYYFLYFAAVTTIIMAALRLTVEILQMRHPVGYLLDWVNWLEIPLYLCSIIFVFVFATPCLCVYHWQWQFGVVAIFLGWIVLITFFQKWAVTGVYVLMFIHVIQSYLKVALLALLLITAFGLAFYLQFYEPSEMRNTFSHPGRALVKVMAMTIGELDYDTVFHQMEGEMEIAFPVVSFILWIVFLVSMPLLLVNYLIGLAVGNVSEIQSIAKESEIKLQIELILFIEETLWILKVLHWFPDIYDKNMENIIFINDPEKLIPNWYAYAPGFIMRRWLRWHISDRFFKTGEEIAEAIKPQPLPLEDQLKQQSKEQAQILEMKLKKQSEDQSKHLELQSEEQGKKLEEKLQKQSEEQSQILEAKLKDQSVEFQKQSEEQIQILKTKLKDQSVEQGKKLEEIDLKMQRKSEEQVQRLEAMLQEQASKTEGHIRQLAGEVASMKETVEELLKKLVSK